MTSVRDPFESGRVWRQGGVDEAGDAGRDARGQKPGVKQAVRHFAYPASTTSEILSVTLW